MSLSVIVFITSVAVATLLWNLARVMRASRNHIYSGMDQRGVLIGAMIVVISGLALPLARGESADFYGLVALTGSCAAVTSLSELILTRVRPLK
jgi:hypothetical protein